MCFSDAFDLQYGVCMLRMREGLDVSHPSQTHGESFICPFVDPALDWLNDFNWILALNASVYVSVNAGFDGEPENVNTISAPSCIQTSSTCMYKHYQMIIIDFFFFLHYTVNITHQWVCYGFLFSQEKLKVQMIWGDKCLTVLAKTKIPLSIQYSLIDLSTFAATLPVEVAPQPNTVFQNKQGKKTIDVYWLSDDGGLIISLYLCTFPQVLANTSTPYCTIAHHC